MAFLKNLSYENNLKLRYVVQFYRYPLFSDLSYKFNRCFWKSGWMIHFAAQQKLTLQCKSTMLQKKIFKNQIHVKQHTHNCSQYAKTQTIWPPPKRLNIKHLKWNAAADKINILHYQKGFNFLNYFLVKCIMASSTTDVSLLCLVVTISWTFQATQPTKLQRNKVKIHVGTIH